MNKYFTLQEMPVVSSRYWNEVHGAAPEEVLGQKGRPVHHARSRPQLRSYFLRCQEAARQAGVSPSRGRRRTDFYEFYSLKGGTP